MADAAAFHEATRYWRHLLDVIDEQRFFLKCHEPFAGLDDVLCAGCTRGGKWSDCPQVLRIAELSAELYLRKRKETP